MKKTMTFLLLLMTFFTNAGDPHYYHWNPIPFSPGSSASSANGFQYGGGDVYYTNPTGLITRAYAGGYEDITGISSVKSTISSPFTYGDSKLFYISSDNAVRSLYKSGSTWVSPILNTSARAAQGDALLFTENSTIFYRGSTGAILKLQWSTSSNTWVFTNTSVLAKANCSFAYGDWKLYFIDPTTSKVKNLINNGTTWIDGGIMCSGAPSARGDGIVFGNAGELFYINNNNDITRLYWTGSSWLFETIVLKNKCVSGGMKNLVFDQGCIFYIGANGEPTVLLKDVCQWLEKPLTSTVAQAPYRLTVGAGKLFCTVGNPGYVNILQSSITNESTYPYVYLKGRTFYDHGNPFYLKAMNYVVDIVTDDDVTYWVEPHSHYNGNTLQCYADAATAMTEMHNHFIQIKNMGFNTLRIMDLNARENTSVTTNFDPSIKRVNRNLVWPSSEAYISMYNSAFKTKYYALVKNVLDAANAEGLKVILCTGNRDIITPSYSGGYLNYLADLASQSTINTHPALLGYDLYNEPSVHQPTAKSDICSLSSSMYSSLRTNDPNHLITINTFGGKDLLTWDPAIISCDFYSFHNYPWIDPVNFEDVKRGFYWASQYIKDKPWIIGETGFSAEEVGGNAHWGQDNCTGWAPGSYGAHGSESQQSYYAVMTQRWVRGSGGSGYSWWQFHDVQWGSAGEDHLGVFSPCNRAKPVTQNFSDNYLDQTNFPCNQPAPAAGPSIYYDVMNPNNLYKLSGFVKDSNGNPIAGAMVIGWHNYGKPFSAFSEPDGSFILWSDSNITDFHASAQGKNVYTTGWSLLSLSSYSMCSGYCAILSQNIVLTDFSCSPQGNYRVSNLSTMTSEISSIIIYPNPSNGHFTINSGKEGVFKLKVYNLLGEEVIEDEYSGRSYTGNLSDLKAGVYLINVTDKDRSITQTLRFILQK